MTTAAEEKIVDLLEQGLASSGNEEILEIESFPDVEDLGSIMTLGNVWMEATGSNQKQCAILVCKMLKAWKEGRNPLDVMLQSCNEDGIFGKPEAKILSLTRKTVAPEEKTSKIPPPTQEIPVHDPENHPSHRI